MLTTRFNEEPYGKRFQTEDSLLVFIRERSIDLKYNIITVEKMQDEFLLYSRVLPSNIQRRRDKDLLVGVRAPGS